jgi:hypothetical protein
MIVGLVVLPAAAVLVVALWPRDPRPCRATFEQVRDGMTYDEVCATVGGPPGDYSDGRNDDFRSWVLNISPHSRAWGGRNEVLIVWLNDDNTISDTRIGEYSHRPLFRRFLEWVGL